MAPAGNQPATEKTDEPKLGLERVVKGGEQNRPEGSEGRKVETPGRVTVKPNAASLW